MASNSRLTNGLLPGDESSSDPPTIPRRTATPPITAALARGYTTELLGVAAESPSGEVTRLWCDPLTGLVAYPSFAEYLTECLPDVAPLGLHIAIGDVDDLSEYVLQQRADDPTMFGHLAGNHCMATIGRITLDWTRSATTSLSFFVCGTFGGDEVIVAAAGGTYDQFIATIRELTELITVEAPRTCSFAVGTLAPARVTKAQAPSAYRRLVSAVDSALFHHKAEVRADGRDPRGELKEGGTITTA